MVKHDELTQQIAQGEYQAIIDQIKPKPPIIKNFAGAFLVGGLICLIGQIFLLIFIDNGLSQKGALGATVGTMVFIGSLLTGLGVYDNLAKFAGAGSIVPITGFANSIVAPAIEHKSEGYVLGLASKMFVVAGPVITFGFIVSAAIGLIYYFLI